MKPSAKSAESAPAESLPPPAAPAFDAARAVQVTPTRHDATARTFTQVQADGGRAHLFSYAGDFIATVPAADVAALLPPAKAAA